MGINSEILINLAKAYCHPWKLTVSKLIFSPNAIVHWIILKCFCPIWLEVYLLPLSSVKM